MGGGGGGVGKNNIFATPIFSWGGGRQQPPPPGSTPLGQQDITKGDDQELHCAPWRWLPSRGSGGFPLWGDSEKPPGAIEAEGQEDLMFQPNQSLAVIWDVGGNKRWYIGFYFDDNGDGAFRVDHLMRAGTGDETELAATTWHWWYPGQYRAADCACDSFRNLGLF